jgi:hypothetical protein
VDGSVAKAVGLTAAQVCAIKESGIDLAKPKGRIEDAIAIYYRNLIQYTLDQIRKRMETTDVLPTFDAPVMLVCGGGTSLVGGFIDLVRQELERSPLPVQLKEVRLARDPLHTVGLGCLQAAQQETIARFGKHLASAGKAAPIGREHEESRAAFSVDVLDKVGAPGSRPEAAPAVTPKDAQEILAAEEAEVEAEEAEPSVEPASTASSEPNSSGSAASAASQAGSASGEPEIAEEAEAEEATDPPPPSQ